MSKVSFAEALCGILALILAELVLAKNIRLEVVVLDWQPEVREAKQPQKVSTFLKQSKYYYLITNSDT